MKFILCALGIIALAASVSAEDLKQTQVPVTTVIETTEVQLLKSQIVMYKEFEDKLLSNVHWTLAVIGALVVLLIGYGWYSNYTVYARDKKNLLESTNMLVERKMTDLEKSLTVGLEARTKALQKEMSASLQSANEQLQLEVHSSIETIEQELIQIKHDMLLNEFDDWSTRKVYANAVRAASDMILLSMKMALPDPVWVPTTSCGRVVT